MTASTQAPAPSAPSAPRDSEPGYERWRLAVVGALGVVAAVLVVLLFLGIDSTRLRVGVLALASAAIAALAALLPTSWRARSALVVTTFVAAAGVLPTVVTSSPAPDPPTPPPDSSTVNADYLAELIREGPFTEPLPPPLVVTGLTAANVSGVGSAHRIDATQVVVVSGEESEPGGISAYAWIETYRTEGEARSRAEAAFADAKERLMTGGSTGDPSGFTVSADGYWVTGGWRGFTYAEMELSPNASSTEGVVSGTLAALLDYAARMTKLAEAD